jgi:uncharacterized protein (DUF1330 family)
MLIAAKITDRERFINDYAPAAAKVVARFGGRYLYRGRGATLLEGGFGDGASTMISEWPDKAAAEAFWNSPEYAKAKKLREGAADCQVLLVEMERFS